MLYIKELKPNIYCFKGINYNDLTFHGPVLQTDKGSSYNSYLIIDEQITLIDTMDEKFCEAFFTKLNTILNGRKIDNIIVNHVEPDHSGSYTKVKKMFPDAKSYCSKASEKSMRKMYFGDYTYEVVSDLETLSIGKYTLKFILTPLIHWPDNMITYLEEEKILFSNDAFGTLTTSSKIYDDEFDLNYLFNLSKIYYANILMPCSSFVNKRLKELADLNLEFDLVCPSHGAIWRSHFTEIFNKYLDYSSFKCDNKVVIIFDTIWNNTEKIANQLAVGLASTGLEVKVFRAGIHRPSLIMSEILDAKAVLIGTSNFNNSMLGTVADILERIYALKPKNKVGMAFGSYGWNKVHLKRVEDRLEEAGIKLIEKSIYTNFKPTKDEEVDIENIGKTIGNSLL